jgi:acetylornithine deacetylase/succinyl-diaminopimelate desuccinylase-like protein
MMKQLFAAVLIVFMAEAASAQATFDWKALEGEATTALQAYLRIDTSNPPGDVTKAADLLSGILEREGIPVQRFVSAPGRTIVLARLAAPTPGPTAVGRDFSPAGGRRKPIVLLHHMDVVPTDRSRWARDPFGGEIAEGRIRGRGAMDMKGIGIAHLYALIALKRQHVRLDRDIIFMAVPDEEIGGELGAKWMREKHYGEFEPEYILDEGGFGSRDLFAPGKLVFGISVAEKKIIWLKVTAEGVAGHGSQPHDRNPNDRLIRALARLLAEPMPTSSFSVLETLKQRVGTLAPNKFTNAIQHSTISITSFRSGVGEPPKVNVIPSIAEATLDCRVLPGTSKEQWLKDIARRLADPELKIEVTYESEDPLVTTQDSVLYRALESAVKRRHPEAIVTPIVIPYGTDSNGYRPRGVKSYGFMPAILPAEAVASMHGDAEFIPADALGPAIGIFFEALREAASR